MTVPSMIDPSAFADKYLTGETGDHDLAREMLATFAEALMSAQASALCEAGYGERTDERVNSRNGYRHRPWDTRVGSIDLAIPKLREGTYYPDWLLQPRRRAEQALVAVIGQAYVEGVSTRRVDEPCTSHTRVRRQPEDGHVRIAWPSLPLPTGEVRHQHLGPEVQFKPEDDPPAGDLPRPRHDGRSAYAATPAAAAGAACHGSARPRAEHVLIGRGVPDRTVGTRGSCLGLPPTSPV